MWTHRDSLGHDFMFVFCGVRTWGGDAHLARAGWRGVEDARLHLGGQAGVDGQDDELRHRRAQALHALEQDLARGVDLVLACARGTGFRYDSDI